MRLPPSPERPELDRLIEAARHYKMSPAEIREQKISFVFGNLMDCSPLITREMVARTVDEAEGR